MERGITVRIDRAEAMRLLGAKIRQESQEFEQAKKRLPAQVEQVRKTLLRSIRVAERKVKSAKTLDALKGLAHNDILDYKQRNKLPSVPQLNLCNMNNHLGMLRLDKRKVIPINSNSMLWSLLEGKCEITRA